MRRIAALTGIACICAVLGLVWATRPSLEWPDRRPIGALFIADYSHASPVNPRGWFNNRELDVHGDAGLARFRKALLDYADRSVAILKRTGSQGMIVWDLEGEEFPQKTSYIGDPRLLPRLAPEADLAADEFFGRFRQAGLAVGLTIRPQQLTFDADGTPRQENVGDYERLLLEKIDYARRRWGATLFYIDSNGGPRWLAEVFHIQRIARQRPGILLIPEHHDPLYYGSSAPYGSIPRGDSQTGRLIRWFYPQAFQVLNVSDARSMEGDITAAYRNGDILLFPGWMNSYMSRIIESLSGQPN